MGTSATQASRPRRDMPCRSLRAGEISKKASSDLLVSELWACFASSSHHWTTHTPIAPNRVTTISLIPESGLDCMHTCRLVSLAGACYFIDSQPFTLRQTARLEP